MKQCQIEEPIAKTGMLIRKPVAVETDAIRSKAAAATWAIDRLPEQYRPVMKRAGAIYKGEEKENWDDIPKLIKPCADFIAKQINHQISMLERVDSANKAIKLCED